MTLSTLVFLKHKKHEDRGAIGKLFLERRLKRKGPGDKGICMYCKLFAFHCMQQKVMVEFVQGRYKIRAFHKAACATLMVMESMDRAGKNIGGEIC